MKKFIRYFFKKYGLYDIDNIGGLEWMNKCWVWCVENVEMFGLLEFFGCFYWVFLFWIVVFF